MERESAVDLCARFDDAVARNGFLEERVIRLFLQPLAVLAVCCPWSSARSFPALRLLARQRLERVSHREGTLALRLVALTAVSCGRQV